VAVPMHLSLVTLGVTDLDRSTRFYEALGWERSEPAEASIAFFRFDNVVIALFGSADLAADAMLPASAATRPPDAFRGVTLAINVLTTNAVDRIYAEWVAAGAVAVKPPVATEWGGYSGYVADPDGHLWELAHNPYSPEWAAPVSE
jgi:predicted lactoylglutathione lyase